jgi:hypothetical protein
MNPFLNGDGGVYSQSGENALGAVKRTQEAFQKIQDEIAGPWTTTTSAPPS